MGSFFDAARHGRIEVSRSVSLRNFIFRWSGLTNRVRNGRRSLISDQR